MRTSTFANIGTDISSCKTSEEVLNSANLNYNVIKKAIKYQGNDGTYYDYPDKVRLFQNRSAPYDICSYGKKPAGYCLHYPDHYSLNKRAYRDRLYYKQPPPKHNILHRPTDKPYL